MSQIVTGRNHIVETEFGDGLGQGASEAGCLSNRREIRQIVRGCGGVNDASGERFDAETGNGRKLETSHGLRGETRGKLCQRERVNALAAGGKSPDGELRGGGSRGRDHEYFAVRGEERGSALEQRGVGAGVNKR